MWDAGFSRKRGGNAGPGQPLPDPVFIIIADVVSPLIISMKEFLHSNWLRAVPFFSNSAEKS